MSLPIPPSRPLFMHTLMKQTVATLTAFIVAVLLNPEAQKKAQQEIDSVIGHDRLPDFDDEGSLPYVTALVMESFRWRDVGPMSKWCMSSHEACIDS